MSKIIETVKGLPNYSRVGKTSDAMINDSELLLGLKFANEYREYLAEFGAVSGVGIELTGIISVDYRHVVSATKQEWEFNLKVPRTMYVVENVYFDDIIIWQDADGSIYRTMPNAEPKQIASSLSEYILGRVKR